MLLEVCSGYWLGLESKEPESGGKLIWWWTWFPYESVRMFWSLLYWSYRSIGW